MNMTRNSRNELHRVTVIITFAEFTGITVSNF